MRSASGALLLLAAGAGATRLQTVLTATDVLQDKFQKFDGLWECPAIYQTNASKLAEPRVGDGKGSWWNCGVTLEAVCNEIIYAKSTKYSSSLSKVWAATLVQYPLHKSFAGLDDIQWWAVAWTHARDATSDDSYLSRSKGFFDETTGFWDDKTCGGGVWWDRKKTYKNAITNELFITLATRLFQQTHDSKYRDWAKKAWNWFNGSGMINSDHMINDGLSSDCTNNGGRTWTYNQGVILGGLLDLYRIEGSTTYLDAAVAIADATIARKSSGGVLREGCEPNCNNNGAQFKGIFVRYLGYLAQGLPDAYKAKRDAYAKFLSANAASAWSKGCDSSHACGMDWAGPPGTPDGISHTSALDLFNADLLLNGPN